MNSQDIDEAALDTEALQAQIDLSMSFAQGLISSWMAPHKYPASSRKKDLEKDLKEYMRRPPRLGVGASVPEGHQSVSRETARLKGKLVGSKRIREEEDAPIAQQTFDEESRAVSIKKKARPDPFDVVHGKKKKQKTGEPVAAPPALSSHKTNKSKSDSSGEVEDILLNALGSPKSNVSNSVSPTPTKDKKNNKKKATETLNHSIAAHNVDSSVSQVSDSPALDTKANAPDSPRSTQSKLSQTPASSESQAPKRSDLSTKPPPPALAGVPLLNLTGPPSDPESDGEHAASPKKKRKRRKKKKHAVDSSPPAANVT